MKTIQKKVSLEQFKSRMPSIIPAYDENGEKHNFTPSIDVLCEPIVNYGMLPLDIQIDNDANLGEYSGKTFSYQQLVETYHQLDAYYNKPIPKGCYKTIHISEEDKNFYHWLSKKCFPFFIFDVELKNETDINIDEIKNYWNVNRLSIQDVGKWYKKMERLSTSLDCCEQNEFKKRGGKKVLDALKQWYDSCCNIIVCNKSDYNHEFVYEVKDDDRYVNVKVIKKIKNKFEVSYHSFEIFEPRVRVLGNNRYICYGKIDEKGNVINPQNIDIIDNILVIPNLFTSTDSVLIISEPHIIIPLVLTNNMENIGEMMPICEEWDRGYEYNQNILNQESIKYSGGPIVYYNGDNWILKSYEYPGYIYSKTYQEVYFANEKGMDDVEYYYFKDNNNKLKEGFDNSEQWEKYLSFLPKISALTLNEYTYKDNQLILSPNPFIMGDKYNIETNDNLQYSLYEGNLYANFECNYIEYQNKIYQVFYVYENYHPYIIINNIRVYINKPNCSSTNQFTILNGRCFLYEETLKSVSGITQIDGYITYKNEKILFINDNGSMKTYVEGKLGEYVSQDEMSNQNNNFSGYTTYQEDNIWYTVIANPYKIYNSGKISGTTTSRINDIVNDLNFATDNLGNKFNGLMPYKEIGIQNGKKSYFTYITNPSQDDWLSIPYIPQQVNNLDEIEENKFWGNIIYKVTLIYGGKTFECTDLNTLRKEEKKLQNFDNSTNIYCQVEYYMGTMIKNGTSGYTLSWKDEENNEYYGIKYIDLFILEKQQCLYYYDEMDACILNYWKIHPITDTYTNQTYNVENIVEPISHFEFNIKPFELQYGYKLYSTVDSFIFYKVNELSETVEYGSDKTVYPIEFFNGQKCFSFSLKNDVNIHLFSEYEYYYKDEEGRKHYAQYEKNDIVERFLFKISDDIIYYSVCDTNGKMINNWVDSSKVQIPYTVFCQIPIKLYFLTPQNSEDLYFDYTNDMTLSPLIFDENKLGQAIQKNINEDIYIDRGSVRAMDFHLRLLESKSLKSLEQIGNGFFKFNSNNEVK